MGGVPDGAGVHDGSLMVHLFHPVQSLMVGLCTAAILHHDGASENRLNSFMIEVADVGN